MFFAAQRLISINSAIFIKMSIKTVRLDLRCFLQTNCKAGWKGHPRQYPGPWSLKWHWIQLSAVQRVRLLLSMNDPENRANKKKYIPINITDRIKSIRSKVSTFIEINFNTISIIYTKTELTLTLHRLPLNLVNGYYWKVTNRCPLLRAECFREILVLFKFSKFNWNFN